MHFVRLGPTTLNLDFLIAADEDDREPGTLLVESVSGRVRRICGEHAETLRGHLDRLAGEATSRGDDGGEGSSSPPLGALVREVSPAPAAIPSPRRRRGARRTRATG
jgi:hypothetical protein